VYAQTKGLFDLIILDLGMPIMNGYEACTAIKSLYTPNTSEIISGPLA